MLTMNDTSSNVPRPLLKKNSHVVPEIILDYSRQNPKKTAIITPGHERLSYAGLANQLSYIQKYLSSLGLGVSDTVAVIVPDGPEMAVATIGVSAVSRCAPLNPDYRERELHFFLDDLNAKALIIDSTIESPAHDIARSLDIEIIHLVRDPEAVAGVFSLRVKSDRERSKPGDPKAPSSNDVALLLYTSGTTARPKLVPLTHKNLCASAQHIATGLQLTAEDRSLIIMPLVHIHGWVGALLSSLYAGGSVVCARGFYAPEFFNWLLDYAPTWYSAVPTMHRAIVQRHSREKREINSHRLRFIRSSSSPLPARLEAEMETLFSVPVIQAYGMTEASHQIATNPLPPKRRKSGSVGRPTGVEVAIMSPESTTHIKQGDRGEIVIRGESLATGYANNTTATAESFVEGWFRTGDEGYLDAEGYLYLTGRLKEMINRGGENIAPLAVEEVLHEHQAVSQAVVFSLPDDRVGEEVGAAVKLKPGFHLLAEELRNFCALQMVDFSVPKRIVFVDHFPTSATGKINRRELAEKLSVTGTAEREVFTKNNEEVIHAQSDIEKELRQLWQSVLKLPEIGVDESFLDVGGDSILAALLISRIKKKWGVTVSMVDFFAKPNIPAQVTLIERGILRNDRTDANSPIRKESISLPRKEPLLSFVQERLWFMSEYAPDEPTVNRPLALRFLGSLEIDVLERCLIEIVRRHDVLRSRIVNIDGRPSAVIDPVPTDILVQSDRGFVTHAQRERVIKRFAREQAHKLFDLTNQVPIRAALLKLDDQDYVLCLTMHHIAFDGWSEGLFIKEIGQLYDAFARGENSPLKDLTFRYSDFVHWQREWLQGNVIEQALDFWVEKLDGAPTILNLPTDFSRPPARSSAGATVSMCLGSTLTSQLEEVSRQEGVTLFVTLLTAFEVLLGCYSKQDEFVVGCPTAGRPWTETEDLIGVFINTLVFRPDLSGDPSFRDLLQRTKTESLHAFSQQHLPFEKLVEALRIERDPSRTPLFQVMFELRNYHTESNHIDSIEIERVDFDSGIVMQDLALDIRIEADGLHCFFKFSTELFEQETVKRMAGHYRNLLRGISTLDLDHPISDIPLLSEEERHYLLDVWNDTDADYPTEGCIHEWFERLAAQAPNAIALEFCDTSVTYGQLNSKANQLAFRLRELGVGPDVPVGIFLPRSVEIIAGVLGILKAGGCYLPLDPDHPPTRQAEILLDANATVLITNSDVTPLPGYSGRRINLDDERSVIDHYPDNDLESNTTPEDLMYLIYTSGSTGKPKGVLITHGNVLNYTTFERDVYDITQRDRVLLTSSLAWDAATDDIFSTLLSGGTLIIPTDEESREPDSLIRLIDRHRVSALLGVVPSLGRSLVEAMNRSEFDTSSLRLILSVGETLNVEDAINIKNAFGRSLTLINHFGCTESTGSQLYFRVGDLTKAASTVPIGNPAPNSRVYILDSRQNLLPVGVPGEICIGGAGLARGYHRRPQLTAERFIQNPFDDSPDSRLYRTGDLGRIRNDGALEHLGRMDFQIKVRGHRIEPGEIEFNLRAHPQVTNAAVLNRSDKREDRLVAYLTTEMPPPSVDEIRQFLGDRLPRYMVPSVFVTLEQFELTPNGKLDRSKLPEPDLKRPEGNYTPSSNEEERLIITIWSELLGIGGIGIDDDFFALGGHSLMAFRVVSRIQDVLGVDVQVRDIFEHPTPAALAGFLQARRGTCDSDSQYI